MKYILIILLFSALTSHCFSQEHVEYYDNGNRKYQEVKKDEIFVGKREWWFENGEKKTEAQYDDRGVLIRIKQWNETGELVTDKNLKKEQKKAGKTDLSHIKWTTENKIDFNYINQVEGKTPEKGDLVTLHYIGYFDNGEQFDNSIKRNEPISIEVGNNSLIDAFANSITKFRSGQKGYVRIPSDLAYGDKPSGNIPANSRLTYYIEILEIK